MSNANFKFVQINMKHLELVQIAIILVISNIKKIYIVKIANCSYTLFVHSTGLDLIVKQDFHVSLQFFTVLSVCLFNHI